MYRNFMEPMSNKSQSSVDHNSTYSNLMGLAGEKIAESQDHTTKPVPPKLVGEKIVESRDHATKPVTPKVPSSFLGMSCGQIEETGRH